MTRPRLERRPRRGFRRAAFQLERRAPADLAFPGLDGAVAVTADGGPVAAALVDALVARGVPARLVEQADPETDVLVIASGLGAEKKPLSAHWAALAHAKRAAARMTRSGGGLVTLQDTAGLFGAHPDADAWRGGFSGLAKTAAREWPEAAVKAIDVAVDDDPHTAARRIADELLAGGPETEVGIDADGVRRVPVLAPHVPARTSGPSSAGPLVIIATGGARGVTAAALLALAERRTLRVALLGRTEMLRWPAGIAHDLEETALRGALARASQAEGRRATPNEIAAEARRLVASREIQATLDALAARGAEARYLAADAADAAAVKTAVDAVRADWGPITGVVHGAGVLADKLIRDKTKAQFKTVFRTKAAGLKALLDAVSGDPLAMIALFSSAAARFGNAGQADYAMANEVLCRVAHAEAARRRGCAMRVFDWGPWDGGMVDAGLKAHFDRAGVPLVPLDAGAAFFANEALNTEGPVELVVGADLPAPPRTLRAGLRLAPNDPVIADHVVNGVGVLPAMRVLDAFQALARASRDDGAAMVIEDFAVLGGVQVDAPIMFTITAEPSADDPARLALALVDADGRRRYAAFARPRDADDHPPAFNDGPSALWPMSVADAYAHHLFHGPAFHALASLDALDATGAHATLTAPGAPLGAANGVDIALLDGALQAALLWGLEPLGGGSLPARIARVTPYAAAPAGPLRARLRSALIDSRRAWHDILLTTPDGAPIARLEGVEMVAAPSLGAKAAKARDAAE